MSQTNRTAKVVFKSPQQKIDFGVIVARSGLSQQSVFQAMVQEVVENTAHAAKICVKAAKGEKK